jgi:uncharacterized protein (TIGR02145 family)
MKHFFTISLCFLALSLSVYGQTDVPGCTISVACNYDPAATVNDGSCDFVSCYAMGCTDPNACNFDPDAAINDGSCIYYVDCNGVCGGDWIGDECGNCLPSTLIEYEIDFHYTGEGQTFVVPDGVTSISIETWGAEGYGNEGKGGYVTADFILSPGQILTVYVGGEGVGPTGGFNGGGVGGSDIFGRGGAGGGASDVRSSGISLSDRIIVAGGGGGTGGGCGDNTAGGGHGGDLIGMSGCVFSCAWCSNTGGGGTQTSGGSPGPWGTAGNFGNGGGHGAHQNGTGGGGGYYGGGGSTYEGAGGGSSFTDPALSSNVIHMQGVNSGHGLVVISWEEQFVPDCVLGCVSEQACNFNPEATNDNGSCAYPDDCGVCDGDNSSCSGCTDPQACNFDSDAFIDDGSCDFCFCGPGTIWDSESQMCLIVNPTDTNLDGCTDLNDLMDILAAYGDCAVAEFTCGDLLDYQGYDYETVLIGEQCWFAENLRNTNYANGNEIIGDLSVNEWNAQTEGAWAVYDDDVTNLSLYGRLYNWYAAVDSRELCPIEWHVPSDEEFMTLEIELGMGADYASSAGTRGQEQNLKLKSSPNDYPAWDGNNSSGFSGLPGGYRVHGNYDYPDEALFWSTTINSSNLIWYRGLRPNGILRNHAVRTQGKSIRCIKD